MMDEARGLGAPPERYVPAAEMVTTRLLAEYPELEERYGERGRAFGIHDTAYQIAWIVNAVELQSPERLSRDVLWLREILRARNFPMNVFRRNFELSISACRETGLATPAELDEIATPVLESLTE